MITRLTTIQKIRQLAAEAGSHFFDAAAIRFFDSKISRKVYPVKDGALFITSEKFGGSEKAPKGTRRYSIRFCNLDGDISTIGEFQEFATSEAAHRQASKLQRIGFTGYIA